MEPKRYGGPPFIPFRPQCEPNVPGTPLSSQPLIPFDLATASVPPEYAELEAAYPAGQTPAERVKAILDAAGFGRPPAAPPIETCGFRINVDGAPVFICTLAPHPDAPHLHGMHDGHASYDACTEMLQRGAYWPEG
jgi:hypothetical protein